VAFKESDDQGRSLAADRRRKAKQTVKSGQGDKDDQKRSRKSRKSTKRSADAPASFFFRVQSQCSSESPCVLA
jgi:hypothetical protein